MSDFSVYPGTDARYLKDDNGEPIIICPTKGQMIERGAKYTERADDNGGTFILNAERREIGYVPNSHSEDGVWLYYSSDVREWLGIS